MPLLLWSYWESLGRTWRELHGTLEQHANGMPNWAMSLPLRWKAWLVWSEDIGNRSEWHLCHGSQNTCIWGTSTTPGTLWTKHKSLGIAFEPLIFPIQLTGDKRGHVVIFAITRKKKGQTHIIKILHTAPNTAWNIEESVSTIQLGYDSSVTALADYDTKTASLFSVGVLFFFYRSL